MYKVFYSALIIFWILDILNMPFMRVFDTTYPINEWAWFLIWVLIPSTETIVRYKDEDD